MAKFPLVTLLTDFGLDGPYVAQMKGAILSVCPRAEIIDITHHIPAYDIAAGAFLWAQAAQYFPEGTLHVAVVDPGAGTQRAVLAGKYGAQTFLFPDNGLISFVAESMPLEEIYTVVNTRYLPETAPSATFNGSDIFAPVAGQILNGLAIKELGPQPQTYKRLEITPPCAQSDTLIGQVIYVDSFGNLISNIPYRTVEQHFADLDSLTVSCAGQEIGMFSGAYDFAATGRPLVIFNSMNLVEIAVNRGRAADFFSATRGSEIKIQGKRQNKS